MDIKKKLDENNLKLLSELEKNFQITFCAKNIDACAVFTRNNTATILYNPQKFENESIAHELLHIWLKQFNYISSNFIHLRCADNKKLKSIFCLRLCDHIGNCFDHQKMYPKYLEMGYKSENFLFNGANEKSTIKEIKKLKLSFWGIYRAKPIERYIGHLISIYADHIDNDYTEHLHLLKQKNIELFEIVTNFWYRWKGFDMRNTDPISNSSIELYDSFISDMENWVEQKVLV